MSWFSRAANAFRGRRIDGELEEELQFHTEARAAELIRAGMGAREAEREARRRMGNGLAFREDSRDIQIAPRLEALWRDARFGVRMLGKDRVVTAAAVVSLALAIGACTAAFALIDAPILRPCRCGSRNGWWTSDRRPATQCREHAVSAEQPLCPVRRRRTGESAPAICHREFLPGAGAAGGRWEAGRAAGRSAAGGAPGGGDQLSLLAAALRRKRRSDGTAVPVFR